MGQQRIQRSTEVLAFLVATTFVDQEASPEPFIVLLLICVKKIHARDTTFEVQLAVGVKDDIGLALHVPEALGGHEAIINGGKVFVGPGGAV